LIPAGALPQIPLVELTVLPSPDSLTGFHGLTSDGRRGEEKGMDGKR